MNMTSHQAKKDCVERLTKAGAKWNKIYAKTVSFQGFMRSTSLRVHIVDCIVPPNFNPDTVFFGIKKSSEGGYLPVFRIDQVRDGRALEGAHFKK